MSKKQDTAAIKEEPGDTQEIFPPTSGAVPVAANVSMKLPTFWADAAEVWFAQADAQFAIWSVTLSKTKFYHSVELHRLFMSLHNSHILVELHQLIVHVSPQALTSWCSSF